MCFLPLGSSGVNVDCALESEGKRPRDALRSSRRVRPLDTPAYENATSETPAIHRSLADTFPHVVADRYHSDLDGVSTSVATV